MPAKTRHVEDILRILLAHYKSKFIGGVGGAFVTNCSVNMAVATGVSFSESDIHEILVENCRFVKVEFWEFRLVYDLF